MTKSVKSLMVQLGEEHDAILTTPCLPVNIRLLCSSAAYYNVVRATVKHMENVMDMKFSDYASVQGISGANVGIPFNIVIINSLKDDQPKLCMLNPEVVWISSETTTSKSNCGSLCLDEKIEVIRPAEVTVRYYKAPKWLPSKDVEFPFTLSPVTQKFRRYKEMFYHPGTIQHEIDHNNGILIVDREAV